LRVGVLGRVCRVGGHQGAIVAHGAQLRDTRCEGVEAEEYEEPGDEPIFSVGTSIRFIDGTRLRAQFWRLTKAGGPLVSIFDHRRRYGMPAPVDALRVIHDELAGKPVLDASMDERTGDLRFKFDEDVVLEVFNFTAFEIWELRFPDGTGELSNYALRK
jgi:hypothetical protein